MITGGYRFGFNGMEKDDEIKTNGNSYTTPFRMLDPRLGGRWWSTDPIVKPWESPYAGFANNPIYYSDPSGLDPKKPKRGKGKKAGRRNRGNGSKAKPQDPTRDGPANSLHPGLDLPGHVLPEAVIEAKRPFWNKVKDFFSVGIEFRGASTPNKPVPPRSDEGIKHILVIMQEYWQMANLIWKQAKSTNPVKPVKGQPGKYQQKDMRKHEIGADGIDKTTANDAQKPRVVNAEGLARKVETARHEYSWDTLHVQSTHNTIVVDQVPMNPTNQKIKDGEIERKRSNLDTKTLTYPVESE